MSNFNAKIIFRCTKSLRARYKKALEILGIKEMSTDIREYIDSRIRDAEAIQGSPIVDSEDE